MLDRKLNAEYLPCRVCDSTQREPGTERCVVCGDNPGRASAMSQYYPLEMQDAKGSWIPCCHIQPGAGNFRLSSNIPELGIWFLLFRGFMPDNDNMINIYVRRIGEQYYLACDKPGQKPLQFFAYILGAQWCSNVIQ